MVCTWLKNKKKKTGKRVATVTDSNSRRESEEEESEISEEESPVKRDVPAQHKSRPVRLAQYQSSSAVRSLNDQLSNMDDEERKNLKLTGRIKRVNIAKQDDDEAVISATAYSKMIGGRCTHTECVMDSGCSFPLTTTAVTEALGVEVIPLKQKLEMLDASNRIMDIIGTTRIFIESDILGGRKCVEAAVVMSEKKKH